MFVGLRKISDRLQIWILWEKPPLNVKLTPRKL